MTETTSPAGGHTGTADLVITEVAASADSAWAPVWQQIAEIAEANDLAVYGHTDLCDPPETMQKSYLLQEDSRKVTLVARETDDGPVIAFGSLNMPIKDNTHLCFIWVSVRPDRQRRGIGSRMLRELEQRAAAAGRTTLTTWSPHRDEAGDGEDAIEAPTGVGKLSRSDGLVRLLQRHGYQLEQTERHSQMPVPVPEELLAPLRRQAQEKSDGYRVVTWTGPTPEQYVDDMVLLHTRMSTDVPTGALEFGEETWDADRVRRLDRNTAELGYVPLQASALDERTGRLVAYTRIDTVKAKPEVAFQQDTLVLREHRGHRLGLLVKLANAEALAAQFPQVRRVHTWNAGENQWMLAINVAMGFARASTEGAWQKKLS